MPRFRDDEFKMNEHGQKIWYAIWIGGPTTSKIESCKCSDGMDRTAFITGEPLTYSSYSGYVHINGKRVRGSVCVRDNGEYYFVCARYDKTGNPLPESSIPLPRW